MGVYLFIKIIQLKENVILRYRRTKKTPIAVSIKIP